MRMRLQVLFGIILGLLTAVNGVAGPGESPGVAKTGEQQMGRPLAEMMLYEAAEQAVEDGYARIIPDPETVSTEEEAAKSADAVAPALPTPLSKEGQLVEE